MSKWIHPCPFCRCKEGAPFPFNYNGKDQRTINVTERRMRKVTRMEFRKKYEGKFKDPKEFAQLMKDVGLYSPRTFVNDVAHWLTKGER